MNRTLALLLVTFLGATGLQANFTPAAWHSAALGTAANNGNEWYSFPDSSGNPRILVKATGLNAGSNAARKILTGGPPVWSESASANLALSKQGVFVANPSGGGYLVAPHANKLQVAIFGSAGSAAFEVIDQNIGTYTGISAELDSNGVLHVAYVWNGGTLCYARRNGSPWAFTSIDLPSTTVHNTAVVPVRSTAGTQNFDAYLYYTATSGGVRTLWQSKPGVINSQLLIQWGANPRLNIENFVGLTLRGSRVGSVGRLFYFGSNNSSTWTFKRYDTAGTGTDLETAGNVSPKSIHVAFGPDGRQRVAWYNESTRRIHYLKPVSAGVDVPVPAGQPVALTGTTADPDLLGLHFGPDGTPYILYRRDLKQGFIAFPNDNFDFNGNGRAEILDTAFNSNHAGPETLPLGPAVPGVLNSANRFKIRFPTVGSPSSNLAGGLQTSSANLLYQVEVSSSLGLWTPLSNITYTSTAINGSVQTFVGVINESAPGAFPARFARLKVTRLNYPY